MNLKKSREFVEEMEKPLIIYHKDSDGVCSAALMHEVTGGIALPNDGPGINITENLINIMDDSEDIIFVDLPVDQLSFVEKLEDKKILILDHHPPEKDLSDEDILHENPRFEDPEAYIPASYLVYQVMSDRLEGAVWKAGVGVIGDHGVEDCKDLIDDIEKVMPGIVPDDKYDFKTMKESKLGIISGMIEASKVIEGISGIKESFETVRNSDNPEDLFKSKLLDYYNEYTDKLEEEKRRFEEEAEYFPRTDSYLYEVKSRSSLSSSLANLVSDENPDSFVIIYQKGKGGMKMAARCDSGRFNTAEILKEAVDKEGSAGGHPEASGGFVERGKEEVVLSRLREKLEDLD